MGPKTQYTIFTLFTNRLHVQRQQQQQWRQRQLYSSIINGSSKAVRCVNCVHVFKRCDVPTRVKRWDTLNARAKFPIEMKCSHFYVIFSTAQWNGFLAWNPWPQIEWIVTNTNINTHTRSIHIWDAKYQRTICFALILNITLHCICRQQIVRNAIHIVYWSNHIAIL